MQELTAERGLGDAVDGVADDRQLDRRQVDADLVGAAGLEADAEERVARRGSRATSKCVIASRGVSVSSEKRVGSSRSRPIGASILPLREAGRPRTSAR